jgi:hypothetical protein
MPALVKRTDGSSFRMSGQLGMRVCPFSSKKEMNRSRMVALSRLPSFSLSWQGMYPLHPSPSAALAAS